MAQKSVDHDVSVVIPCYNGMPYLPESLDSALAQTYRPIEIIVVDDGSTDASATTVRQYTEKFPERGIKLIQQANAGESAARNTGIRAATGAWVAMLDTDDWWAPDKLEKQILAAQQAGPDCVLVHTGQITHYPDGRTDTTDVKQEAQRSGRCTKQLVEPLAMSHSSVMLRRDVLGRIGGYDDKLKHAVDIDVFFKLSAQGTFAFVPRHLVHYRIHAQQTSSNYRIDQIVVRHDVIWRFFDKHPKLLEEIGKDFVTQQLCELVLLKLESLYWNRRLGEFRSLLEFAQSKYPDDERVLRWRNRARWPDWLILLKDRIGGRRSSPAQPTTAVGTS